MDMLKQMALQNLFLEIRCLAQFSIQL